MPTRRLVYIIAKANLRPEYVIKSTCGENLCCNPDHMKAIKRSNMARETMQDINARMSKDDRKAIVAKRNGAAREGKSLTTTWHP